MQFENLTDEQLAKKYRLAFDVQSANAYFSCLVMRHRRHLISFLAYYFAVDTSFAEDIVQEAMLKAFVGFKSFDSTRKWKTWLYRIAINVGVEILRQPKMDALEELYNFQVGMGNVERQIDNQICLEKISKALAVLPEKCRKIMNLYLSGDYSLRQISLSQKMPVSVVKAQISIGKKLLAANMLILS